MLTELIVVCSSIVAVTALICFAAVAIDFFRNNADVKIKQNSNEMADKWDRRRQ